MPPSDTFVVPCIRSQHEEHVRFFSDFRTLIFSKWLPHIKWYAMTVKEITTVLYKYAQRIKFSPSFFLQDKYNKIQMQNFMTLRIIMIVYQLPPVTGSPEILLYTIPYQSTGIKTAIKLGVLHSPYCERYHKLSMEVKLLLNKSRKQCPLNSLTYIYAYFTPPSHHSWLYDWIFRKYFTSTKNCHIENQ